MDAKKIVFDVIAGALAGKNIFYCLNDRGVMLHVSRRGLETVRRALEEGKIFARHMVLPNDRGAQYSSHQYSNTIYVDTRQQASDPIMFEANVLHECVHALFDIQGFASLRNPIGEAAAYLMTAIVLKLRGANFRDRILSGGLRNIVEAADNLVYAKKMIEAPGAILDETDYGDLVTKVFAHYQALFTEKRYRPDDTIPWPGVDGIDPRTVR
jgi:hypothetical protein